MALIPIIQNVNADPSVVISLFPGEDFENRAKLVVAEAEEAVFLRDGLAVGVFDGGQYVLDTNNYPWLSRLLRRFTGGAQAFSCKVYFVSRSHHLGLNWGTSSPIQVRDPKWSLQTSVQAYGSYSARVEDSKKLLVKLVGNAQSTYTVDDLSRHFQGAFGQFINDSIAEHIMSSNEEVLAICADRFKLAAMIAPRLEPLLSKYGLWLENFYVESIKIPNNDLNRLQLEDAFAKRGVMNILGEDWGRQQSRDILSDLANNPGAGGVAAAGAATGLGIGAASVFSEMAMQMFKQSPDRPGADLGKVARNSDRFTTPAGVQVECVCGERQLSGAKFCSACGAKLNSECLNCGGPVQPTAKFCTECGTAVV
jgi:membrane protease subunit (stomatin/prohibitin family)